MTKQQRAIVAYRGYAKHLAYDIYKSCHHVKPLSFAKFCAEMEKLLAKTQ